MPRPPSDFDALDRAMMKSGLYRTVGLAAVLVAALIPLAIRAALFAPEVRARFTAGPVAVLLVLIAYEAAMVVLLRRAIRLEQTVPPWIWIANAVVECSMPTAAIVIVWASGVLPADRAVIAPPVFVYTFFIILSILQMRPWLTVVTGAVCIGQYLVLMLAAWSRDVFTSIPGGSATMIMYPVTLALACMCAVFVSLRVRRYVETAVSEATRREHAEREIRAASRVQTGVLPKYPPAVAGFTIAGWTRPAEQAGGDYYDWTELPGGQVVASIADVAGHGLGPALITAFCRAYARSTIQGTASLGDALTRINGLIARDLPPGRFVTFAAARLTPGASDVTLLSAGHGPILHHHAASGDVTALGADELPLGIDPGLAFGAGQTIEMRPGDALVLLTDGFFEWADPTGQAWGIERLETTVRRAADEGPDALIAAMVRDVEAFAGAAPQLDDLTAVVIARDGR